MTARQPDERPSASVVMAAFEQQRLEPLLTDPVTVTATAEDLAPREDRPDAPSWRYRALVLAGVVVVSLVAWILSPAEQPVADSTPTVPPESVSPSSVAPTLSTPSSLPPVRTTEPPVVVPAPEGDATVNAGADNGGSGNGHGRDKNSGRGGGNDG